MFITVLDLRSFFRRSSSLERHSAKLVLFRLSCLEVCILGLLNNRCSSLSSTWIPACVRKSSVKVNHFVRPRSIDLPSGSQTGDVATFKLLESLESRLPARGGSPRDSRAGRPRYVEDRSDRSSLWNRDNGPHCGTAITFAERFRTALSMRL
jgi:hypothetical protein